LTDVNRPHCPGQSSVSSPGSSSKASITQVTPRTAPDQHRAHAGLPRWDQVRVTVITDVHDLVRLARSHLDQAGEEPRVRLGHTPFTRRGDQIGRQAQPAQELTGAGGLVAGDTHPVPRRLQGGQPRPHIGVQVLLLDPFPDARRFAQLPLAGEIEPRTEVGERLHHGAPRGHNGAHDGGERVPPYPEPVRPPAPLPRIVQERFANVEHHRANHPPHLHHTHRSRPTAGETPHNLLQHGFLNPGRPPMAISRGRRSSSGLRPGR
jgi:hypothetical protein